MSKCQICNREFKTNESLDQHVTDKKDDKHTQYRLECRKNYLNTLGSLDKFRTIGLTQITETHIPIHEKPPEKRKQNLVCNAVRNSHR